MCKLFVTVALLAVAAFAHPTADEIQAELIAAGVSSEAAAGLIAIGEKYKSQFEAAKGDKDAHKKIYEEVKAESDTYIKTQSSADQTAYAAFLEKKQAEHKGHHNSTSSSA
ncbi:unnamed protein product [Caenorhabditis sp. 36 PRJEB53466]|nr:unnamed protein product [Caenorhabditis sp. 36 PRJEB53466]